MGQQPDCMNGATIEDAQCDLGCALASLGDVKSALAGLVKGHQGYGRLVVERVLQTLTLAEEDLQELVEKPQL